MSSDINKSSVAVLLVMAIIISVLGTLSVINAYEQAQSPSNEVRIHAAQEGPAKGSVSFTVTGPEVKPTASGTISLTILKGDNQ